ncbi:hypothetical protein L914_00008 [Phytophthora nicotianae]|uniref:Uncharacterized protein n=2 Tax=Phytophthora nicotianae TaxID=4792 RepID=V9G2L2_PHYNI|nr:hypothetical protein F443_00010 [Phytophthora nicotianae P1569]ETM57115.1 hypothetical protein L914_00008 [Phytophthora nicotianae]
MEKEVIQGILEGTMLCPKLPDFLKRICDAQAYRKIQNTIKAQVGGYLLLKLNAEFKIYPQFQTRKRLTHEFLLGINNSENDPAKVTAMLQEAKQILTKDNMRFTSSFGHGRWQLNVANSSDR